MTYEKQIVNGVIVTKPAHSVFPGDKVLVDFYRTSSGEIVGINPHHEKKPNGASRIESRLMSTREVGGEVLIIG